MHQLILTRIVRKHAVRESARLVLILCLISSENVQTNHSAIFTFQHSTSLKHSIFFVGAFSAQVTPAEKFKEDWRESKQSVYHFYKLVHNIVLYMGNMFGSLNLFRDHIQARASGIPRPLPTYCRAGVEISNSPSPPLPKTSPRL